MGMDFQAFKFDFFTISQRSLLIIKLVTNSLKQRIFVDAHDSHYLVKLGEILCNKFLGYSLHILLILLYKILKALLYNKCKNFY